MNFNLNNYTWLVATMLNYPAIDPPLSVENMKYRERMKPYTQIWKRLKRHDD